MTDSHFDQQAAISQANEDKHTWLQRDRLELYILVNLAHSRKAQKLPIDEEPLLPRFRALKDVIDGGKLSALPGTAGNPNADFMSRVALSDLWDFLSQQPEHEAWNWAGAFCREWAQVRGVVLSDSDLAQQPKPAQAFRKRPAKEMHERWIMKAKELKGADRNMGVSEIARKIRREDAQSKDPNTRGQTRDEGTIRRVLHKHKSEWDIRQDS